MIRSWWKDGAWGEVPVRRLGHIVADVINGCEQARVAYTRTVGGLVYPFTLLGDSALVTPEWMAPGGGELTLPATAAQFDGAAVADPCIIHNFKQALAFLVGITEVDPAGQTALTSIYYVGGPTSTAAPTKAALGIDGLTEDSLARPQDTAPWAALRDALKLLRWWRVVLREGLAEGVLITGTGTGTSGTGAASGAIDVGTEAEALETCQKAITSAIRNESSGAMSPPELSDIVSAHAAWFGGYYWLAYGASMCFSSVTMPFRGTDIGPPDLPVTAAMVRFGDAGSPKERVTSAAVLVDGTPDTITDGKTLTWNESKESVTIAFNGTRTTTITDVDYENYNWVGSKGFCFAPDRVGVTYDLDAEE